MTNKVVLGVVVGQAVVTLVSIGYGVSAHSSWEAERQRRLAGERAAVAEMATALKGAGDRLSSVERELQRCRVRARRSVRPAPVPPAAAVPEPDRAIPPLVSSTEESFALLAGPLVWAPPTNAEARVGPADVAPRAAAPPAAPWCAGRYDVARGSNFAPCPSPAGP